MILQRKWFLAFTALVVISLIVGIGQILADSSSSEPEPAVPNKDIQNSELDPEVTSLPNTCGGG